MARFVVRYDSSISDVNPKDRLVFDGRTFDIMGAKEVAGTRRALIEITAAARSD
jgi:head-tail adaptor